MRTVRTVLGWIATILFLMLLAAFALAQELAMELVADWLGRRWDWISWLVLGVIGVAFVGLWAYVLLNPKHWREWRQARADKRERRRRLENFEID